MSLDYYKQIPTEKEWRSRLIKFFIMLPGLVMLMIGFGYFIYKDITMPLPICECKNIDAKTS